VVAAAIDPGHVYDRPLALDDQILAAARLLATSLGTSLQVLNAVLPLVMTEAAGGPLGIGGTLDVRAAVEACTLRRAELESLVAAYGVSTSNLHVRLGVPSEVLPELAQELSAAVLVMGAVSRSGLQRLFIGSTAEQVLESLPCDALVVKSPDFAASLPA